jgi:hypothetical protein
MTTSAPQWPGQEGMHLRYVGHRPLRGFERDGTLA